MFAKQIASTATGSRTNFQISLTAVATVSHESCLSSGALNDAMFKVTHFSRRLRELIGSLRNHDGDGEDNVS